MKSSFCKVVGILTLTLVCNHSVVSQTVSDTYQWSATFSGQWADWYQSYGTVNIGVFSTTLTVVIHNNKSTSVTFNSLGNALATTKVSRLLTSWAQSDAQPRCLYFWVGGGSGDVSIAAGGQQSFTASVVWHVRASPSNEFLPSHGPGAGVFKVEAAQVTTDIAYVQFSPNGYVEVADLWPRKNDMACSSGPAVHLYTNGVPPEGREGLPDRLTVKATLSNTQEKQVKVEALIRELNNQKDMGVVPPTASTSWKDVQVTTSEALEGGSLKSKMVDLLIDGRKVAERATPSSFSGNYVVDFGKIELVEDCKTCTTGFCIQGRMEAKLSSRQ